MTSGNGKSSIIRTRCLTCSRWLDDLDILWGLCAYCLEERAKNATYGFRPISPGQQFPRCYECNQEIVFCGLKTWDSVAKSFKLLCSACGEKQIALDRQYRDTPWGREQNLK